MELLERHFEIALETPDGIKKLRELILTLAMQGKLVPQDSKDQPASELLKATESEKKRLLKEGKIKKLETTLSYKLDDTPYILPNSWVWTRLETIVSLLGDGLHGTPTYDNQGKYFFINGNNLDNGKIVIKNDTKTVCEEEFEKYKKILNANTVLVSINGTIGNVAFYNDENVILGKSACYFNLLNGIDKFFIKNLINSNYFINYSLSNATGSTIKNVSLKSMREFPVPLPPLPEQKRIVAKIDQLMALCDKLDSERNERDQKRLKIHSAATERLLSAQEKGHFNTSWNFITKHFNELYSIPENVADLKKTILQLAVMGKLVPQDPKDQPASELLKEIEAEKKRLVKKGKMKKIEELPPIKPEEIPFEVPKGWEWCRIRNICHDWGQKTPDREFIYIDVSSIDNSKGEISPNVQKIDYTNAPSRARKKIKPGTIIYSTVRPYLLNIAIFEKEYKEEAIASTAFAILHPYTGVYNKFIYYYLHSKSFINYVEKKMKGVAYPAINDGDLFSGLIPLPPLTEQNRIVDKINQLIFLCDSLDKHTKNSTGKQSAILNAVLSQV